MYPHTSTSTCSSTVYRNTFAVEKFHEIHDFCPVAKFSALKIFHSSASCNKTRILRQVDFANLSTVKNSRISSLGSGI